MDILTLKTGLYPEDSVLDDSLERLATEQIDLADAQTPEDWERIVEAILEARLVVCS